MEKRIANYNVEDHGVESSSYFQGAGVSGTRYDTCATGCGETFNEALADALECLAQSDDYADGELDRIEAESQLSDDDNDKVSVSSVLAEYMEEAADDDNEQCDDDDSSYRVSVRVQFDTSDDEPQLENEPQEEDYTISDGRGGGYVVGIVQGRYVGTVDSREAAEAMIRLHAGANFRPSVWIISDHGNSCLVEDFDWKD